MSDTITPTNLATSKMNFVDVAAGQSISVSDDGKGVTYRLHGDPFGGQFAAMTITDPKDFKGAIQASGEFQVYLPGMIADSYSLSGGVMSLYLGSKVIDKITVDDGADGYYFVSGKTPLSPNVTQTIIEWGEVGAGNPTGLPLHT